MLQGAFHYKNFSKESVKAAYAAADAAEFVYDADATDAGAATAASYAAASSKDLAIKIMEKGFEILTPTSVKFMKGL